MTECYADYYTNKNQILTMIEYGTPKERQIALGSLIIHFSNEDHFDLCWRIFLSNEHRDVKYHALNVACRFATNKKIFEMQNMHLDMIQKIIDMHEQYFGNYFKDIKTKK